MQEILLALILLNPIVSKNPVKQDTLALTNIHFTVGYRPANDMVGYGPEVGAKFEYLLFHPIIIRGSVNYSSCEVKNFRLPEGKNDAFDFCAETFLYRGTKELTAYFGGGLVYSLNHFQLTKQLSDSLFSQSSIYKTNIENKYGYRVIMGFRFREHYNFEFGYQESRPNFMFWGYSPDNHKIIIYKDGKLSALRFTLGYIFSP